MLSFEHNVCPLCNKVLKYRLVSKVNVYSCPTETDYKKPHYEVEMDNLESFQHMHVGQWSIDNSGKTTKSRLYKIQSTESGFVSWKLVAEVPQIRADTEENLLSRINTLVPFL